MGKSTVTVNRSPALMPWATVGAEQLNFNAETSMTLGKAVGGPTEQAEGHMHRSFSA